MRMISGSGRWFSSREGRFSVFLADFAISPPGYEVAPSVQNLRTRMASCGINSDCSRMPSIVSELALSGRLFADEVNRSSFAGAIRWASKNQKHWRGRLPFIAVDGGEAQPRRSANCGP